MKVYKAINDIQKELSETGLSKSRKNLSQGYSFRGIDDVLNVLSPLLAKHHLCILPQVISREVVERQTAKGGVIFYVTVCSEFHFVSSEDGSTHLVKTYGEAMDSGDKATNKAMSAAYKYAAIQAFSIPTEGDNDADANTHEIVSIQKQKSSERPKAVENKKPVPALDFLVSEIQKCKTMDELKECFLNHKSLLSGAELKRFDEEKNKRKAELEAIAEPDQFMRELKREAA